MTTEHASNSLEQQTAEGVIRQKLAVILSISFCTQPPELKGLSLDGYAPGTPATLVEIFAHVGRSKSGQQRKLSRDMTKLLLAEKRLGTTCRKVIAVIDKDAIAHTTKGWDGEFAKTFGIEFVLISVDKDMTDQLKTAQERQFR